MMAKLLFIYEKSENITYVGESRYMGAYLGPREELEAWVHTKLEAQAYRVRTLSKIAKRYSQLACAILGMSLRIQSQYLQRTVPGDSTLMGHIEDELREV